eukprot:COSAG03_NODE_446_length_7847_cov_4.635777_10_plen_51_part_00
MQSVARPQNLDNSSCLIKSFLSRIRYKSDSRSHVSNFYKTGVTCYQTYNI